MVGLSAHKNSYTNQQKTKNMKTKIFKMMLALAAFPMLFSCKQDPLEKAIDLDCAIESNMTLTNHNTKGVDYIVNCDAIVASGATLTIDPGVEILFKADASLRIEGVIKAVGNSDQKIYFKAEGNIKGSWEGIFVTSANTANEINHAVISHAGSTEDYFVAVGGSSFDVKAALNIYNDAKISISNLDVNNSGGLGIFVATDAQLLGFNNITVSSCTDYPIMIYAGHLSNGISLSTCTATGNGKQFYSIFSQSSNKEVLEAVTITDTDVPYYGFNSLNFTGNATIQSGVEIVMSSNKRIACTNGFLRITGTAAAPVTMRGENSGSGAWQGIFINTNNSNNIFDYLNISGGGSEEAASFGVKSNILVADITTTSQLTINNCTSTDYVTSQVAVNGIEGTLVNNSPAITVVISY